ncbi:MAG TPA: hypothetical protein VGP21_05220 [Opitutaceae bacterium]|jgi:hypothetical protein|nr:hypothetical protein [Opitutaceae bacterium]
MPSPDDRLQELRRQRALVQEQLTFLDREIAAASGQAQPAKPSPPPVPAAYLQPATPPADGGEASEVIKSFEAESRANPATAKWGCIGIFVAGLVLLALCVAAFYYYVKLHQPPPVH